MSKKSNNILIRNKRNELVAQVGIKNEVLHGHCEWHSGTGHLVAYGLFYDGSPNAGTFLNWAKHFPEFAKYSNYDPEIYCKDWITIFESGFLSEFPKYEMVIEAYCNGVRLMLQ